MTPDPTLGGNSSFYGYNQNTGPYGGAALDASALYNQQAQLYYQQRRQSAYFSGSDPMRETFLRTSTFSSSLKDTMMPPDQVSLAEMRYRDAQMEGARRDLADRITTMGIDSVGAVTNAVGELAATEIGAAAGGLPGAFIAPMAYGKMRDTFVDTTGIGRMSSQFSRINDLQMYSNEFGARSLQSDPYTGRMDRRESKSINDFFENYAKYARQYGEMDVSSDELREEAAIMSENKILESVKNAEDFAKKFSSLRKGIKKMTEVLGKSFEEGAEMIGEMRNLGMESTTTMSMLDTARRMGVESGVGFDAVHASGMQAAYAQQGTGLSAQASYRAGAQAESRMNQMYDMGALSEVELYNLGGRQGVQHMLANLPSRMVNDPLTRLSLMSGFGQGGMQNGYLGGGAGVANAFDGIQSFEDLMMFEGQRREQFNEMTEEDALNPVATNIMSALKLIQSTGMNIKDRNQLLQVLSRQTGMSRDELSVALKAMRTRDFGQGRADLEGRSLSTSRGERTFSDFKLSDAIARNQTYHAFSDLMSSTGQGMSDFAYNTSDNISNLLRQATTGEVRTNYNAAITQMLAEEEEKNGGGPADVAGYHNFHVLNPADGTDILDAMDASGKIDLSSGMDFDFTSVKDARRSGASGLGGMKGYDGERMDDVVFFTDGDLDRMEEQLGVQFSAEERRRYTTREGYEQAYGRHGLTKDEFAKENNLVVYKDMAGERLLNAEPIQGAIDEQKGDAQFFSGVLQNRMDVRYSDLSNLEQETLDKVSVDVAEGLDSQEGRDIMDSRRGHIAAQSIITDALDKNARGLTAEQKERVASLVLQNQFQDTKFEDVIDRLDLAYEVDSTDAAGQVSAEIVAENVFNRATSPLSSADQGGLFSEDERSGLIVDALDGISGAEKIAESLVSDMDYQETLMDAKGMSGSTKMRAASKQALQKKIKALEEEGRTEAADRLRSLYDRERSAGTLDRVRDKLEDNEAAQMNLATYAILKERADVGLIDEESELGRYYANLQDEVQSQTNNQADNLIEGMRFRDGEKRRILNAARDAMGNMEGGAEVSSTGGTGISREEQQTDTYRWLQENLIQEIDALVKQNEASNEALMNYLKNQ